MPGGPSSGPRLLPGMKLVPGGCSLDERGMALTSDAFLLPAVPQKPPLQPRIMVPAPQITLLPPESKLSVALSP